MAAEMKIRCDAAWKCMLRNALNMHAHAKHVRTFYHPPWYPFTSYDLLKRRVSIQTLYCLRAPGSRRSTSRERRRTMPPRRRRPRTRRTNPRRNPSVRQRLRVVNRKRNLSASLRQMLKRQSQQRRQLSKKNPSILRYDQNRSEIGLLRMRQRVAHRSPSPNSCSAYQFRFIYVLTTYENNICTSDGLTN